jgi:hypothetical protein
MKEVILLFTLMFSIYCNKKLLIQKTSKENLILNFCKLDVKVNSKSTSTIKYDSLLTKCSEIKENNNNYYDGKLDDAYHLKQINDSTSRKWRASIHFDLENKYSVMNSNNVIYIIKENAEYKKDSISNEQFIILSKRDENKLHEYLDL